MIGAMSKMKMKGDTTLQDLLDKKDYQKVKDYFETKGSMLPFSMLETYKPMLAASTLQQGCMPCEINSHDGTGDHGQASKEDKKDQRSGNHGLSGWSAG